MAKAKYERYFEKMLVQEPELFEQFREIHDRYKQDQDQYKAEFDRIGKKVVASIHHWERRLCTGMGKTQYAVYAHSVSEKFWDLVRQEFDQIDMVGVKIS